MISLSILSLQAARTFSQSLSRQTELSHMASVARSVLHNAESIRRLQQDWKKLDKESIAKQCTWLLDDENKGVKLIAKCKSVLGLLRCNVTLNVWQSFVSY
jgi:transcriptional regulator with GAF, ATPase, and Fis domain